MTNYISYQVGYMGINYLPHSRRFVKLTEARIAFESQISDGCYVEVALLGKTTDGDWETIERWTRKAG